MIGDSRPVSFHRHATTAATNDEFADLAERVDRYDPHKLREAMNQHGAICAEVGSELFFPELGVPTADAKALCNGGLLNAAARAARVARREEATRPLLVEVSYRHPVNRVTDVMLGGNVIGSVSIDRTVGFYRAWRWTLPTGERSTDVYANRAEAVLALRGRVDPAVQAVLDQVAIYDATDDRSRVCPLRDLCLQSALSGAVADGVWGGVGEEKRRRILAKMRRASRVREGLTFDPPTDVDDFTVDEHPDQLCVVAA